MQNYFMWRFLFLIIVFLMPIKSFADQLIIRTINGVNFVKKQDIIDGPQGYLKSVLSYEDNLRTPFEKDGSLFVNVDNKSLEAVLSYLRNKKIPIKEIGSSSIIEQDFNFLLPGILEIQQKKSKPKKVWECAAYCDFSRPIAVEFMSTTHVNKSEAWQNLNNLCAAKGQKTYLVVQKVPNQDDYVHALASMGNSCFVRTL